MKVKTTLAVFHIRFLTVFFSYLQLYDFILSCYTSPLVMALSETFVEIHQRRADRRGVKGEERGRDGSEVTYEEKTEQCHHQTDAIMKPLGKQKGRYIQDKLEKKHRNKKIKKLEASGNAAKWYKCVMTEFMI